MKRSFRGINPSIDSLFFLFERANSRDASNLSRCDVVVLSAPFFLPFQVDSCHQSPTALPSSTHCRAFAANVGRMNEAL